MHLLDLVKTYDDVIPEDVRKSLIRKFNTVPITREFDTDGLKFKEVFIQNHPNIFKKEFDFAFNAFNRCVQLYLKEKNIRFFPEKYGYEVFRLKRYTKSDGWFKEHVDVTGTDSMKRFFSFFCYLNDGGGTRFTDLDFTVESKPGRLLLFPPMWMFPHEALVSEENNKYLLHTYLHYV